MPAPRLPRLLLACASLLVASCATGVPTEQRAAPTSTRSGFSRPSHAPRTAGFPAYSATARGPSLQVRTAPDGPPLRRLDNPQPSGAPLVLLVVRRQGQWVQVQLPVRPNGTTGWVRAGDVTLAGLPYRVDVRLDAHRLDVYRFDRLEHTYVIGVGRAETPTPGGTFYLKELLRPPDPAGAYGPYAYGLSGFSTTLTSFAGGEGVIGIHGTDHPELVGQDVSHGCIRLRNQDITVLAEELPLGTPVRILA